MGTIAALCLLCHPWACLPAGIFLLMQVCICSVKVFVAQHLCCFALLLELISGLTQKVCVSQHALTVQVAIVALPVGDAPYIVERYAPRMLTSLDDSVKLLC